MKNLLTIAFLSSVMMISCSKENETTTTTQKSTKFYASIEASETRTYVDTDCKQFWSANDLITIFKGDTYPRKYQYNGESGSNNGVFNEIENLTDNTPVSSINANYAIYPYNDNTTISEDGKISYAIPAIQNYVENSFGPGANTMVAVTKNADDNYLNFKNIGGYFEFSLYGKDITVKSIELKGNNGEKLAGVATIATTYNSEPIMNFTSGATETLTLDCGEDGVEVGDNEGNATKFWFVVPAKEYSKGITITITNVDGSTMKKSTSNSILIKRSTVQPLEAFEVIPTTPPYNQIWYTTTNNNPITCGYTNVISHSYDNGKGVITFDSNITWIKHYAFQLCTSLKSITIPNSVESIGQEAFSGCSNLTSVNIPNGVTEIGRSAFFDCRSLTNIDIPNSVKTIGDWAFWRCNSIIVIKIPENVEFIGMEAFADCGSLKEVYCKPITAPTGGKDMFNNNPSDRKIYVPTESKDTYKAANAWKNYADYIEGYDFE